MNINNKISTLIGFAIKSRQVICGFEAVTKAIERKKIILILVKDQTSTVTYNKLKKQLKGQDIPIINTSSQVNWETRWGISRHHILGILNGIIGNNIIQQFKAGV